MVTHDQTSQGARGEVEAQGEAVAPGGVGVGLGAPDQEGEVHVGLDQGLSQRPPEGSGGQKGCWLNRIWIPPPHSPIEVQGQEKGCGLAQSPP